MTATEKLRGVMPAILTPMDESGDIDLRLLEKQVGYLSDAGVHGFAVGGTNGEGAYLSTDEKSQITRVIRGACRKDQLILSVCIQPSTRDVIAEMKELARTNPDFFVATTPYYHRMEQSDIVEHYRSIAEQASAPLVLYNIPSMTHNPMALETILELADDPRIPGIKDSSGDFGSFSWGVLDGKERDFAWIQGADLLDGASMMLGCAGTVTGLGNARIEPYIGMYAAAQRGDWDTVKSSQAAINRLFKIVSLCGNSVGAIKAASEIEGRGSRWMRQRSQTVSDEHFGQIEMILKAFSADA